MPNKCRFQGECKLKSHYVQNLFYLVKYTFLIREMGLRGHDLVGPFQLYESMRV